MKADSRGRRAALHVLAGVTVLLAGAPSFGASKERIPGVTVEGSRVYDPERDGDPVINNLERRTFRFFWDTTNKQNGLAAGPLSLAVVRQHRRPSASRSLPM